MIEFFGKSTERVASSTEKTELPANFDPDKRFAPKEKGNSLQDSQDAFDPDKRFIPKENGSSLQDSKDTFDPDKRFIPRENGSSLQDSRDAFDPDKRFIPKENGNTLQDSKDAFDPDKRFIPKENRSSLQDSKDAFDPDKRFIPKENGSSLQDSKDTFDSDKRYVPKEDGSSLQDRDETFNPDIRVYSGVPSREKTNVLKEESDIDKRVADSENEIQNTDINSSENEEVRQIKTRNEELEGKKHPETGVNIKEETGGVNEVVNPIDSMKEPNSTYEINDHTYKTDDNGNIYNVDGKNLPNCRYELNGYEYETDEKGRIIRAEGDLELPPYQPRPKSLPDIEDRRTEEDERGRDDKGHLIAHEFGGDDTEGNLVPMNSEVNEYGEYRNLERELKNAKEEGHDVHVTVEPQYDDDSKRPSSFFVTYTIDGERNEKVIINEAKSGEN